MTTPAKTKQILLRMSRLPVCGLLAVLFLLLTGAALFTTSIIDPDHFMQEHILIESDPWLLNILIACILLALWRLLSPWGDRVRLGIAAGALLIWTTLWGGLWVFSVQSIPAADSGSIASAAAAFLTGDYSPLIKSGSYFRYFPFQLCYTFFSQGLMALLGAQSYGALGFVNVLMLDAAYLALIRLSMLLFPERRVTLLTILLLAVCPQGVLFCTFIYGNIPGLALSLWAMVFTVRYIQTGRNPWLIPAVLCIAMAVALKLNYAIVLAAMAIVLAVHCIGRRRPAALIGAACAVALTWGLTQAIVTGYERRAGTDLGDGVPKILWTAMGLQESTRAPGWYNKYTINTFDLSGKDGEAAAQTARESIAERLGEFASDPGYTLDFFTKKTLSQWNEPTYESIWVSQVKNHAGDVPAAAQAVYDGTLGKALQLVMNLMQQLIYAGFFLAMAVSLRKADLPFLLLPVAVLGGFLYHFVNEAKSQYILVYFLMLIPYAAWGIDAAVHAELWERVRKRFGKLIGTSGSTG